MIEAEAFEDVESVNYPTELYGELQKPLIIARFQSYSSALIDYKKYFNTYFINF